MPDKMTNEELCVQLSKVQAVAVANHRTIQALTKAVDRLYEFVLPAEKAETMDELKNRVESEDKLKENQAHLDKACQTINDIADSTQHSEKKL